MTWDQAENETEIVKSYKIHQPEPRGAGSLPEFLFLTILYSCAVSAIRSIRFKSLYVKIKNVIECWHSFIVKVMFGANSVANGKKIVPSLLV